MADEEVRLKLKMELESVYEGDPRKNLKVNHALQRLRCNTLPMEDIIKDYQSGMSLVMIADWHGVSHCTIINRLKEAGVYQPRPIQRRSSKKELPMEEVIKDYQSGMSLYKLAHKYKVSRRTLRRRFVESGTVLRGGVDIKKEILKYIEENPLTIPTGK
jgi:exonuclease VII small subunit